MMIKTVTITLKGTDEEVAPVLRELLYKYPELITSFVSKNSGISFEPFTTK